MTWDLSIQLWQMAITWDGAEAIFDTITWVVGYFLSNFGKWQSLEMGLRQSRVQAMGNAGQCCPQPTLAKVGKQWEMMETGWESISFHLQIIVALGLVSFFFLNRRQKQWELMKTEEKPPYHHLMACYPFPRGGIFRLDQSNTTDAMGCVGLNTHTQRVMF